MKKCDAIERALNLLGLIEKKQAEYRELNKNIEKVVGRDFPLHVKYCDEVLECAIMDIIDSLLADNMMAHWYLYDRPRHGGTIAVDGKEYVVKDIQSLKDYYYATRSIKR